MLLVVALWALMVFGILLFLRGASYKDNISRDPKYYEKD